MNINEFAHSHCSHIIRSVSAASLYEQLASKDDLPYDAIDYSEDGVLTKIVYLNDEGRKMDIYELIAHTAEDIDASGDEELIQVYHNYMANIDIEPVDFADMLQLVRKWKAARDLEDGYGNVSQ